MKFFRRSPGVPARLGILPGTFNPLTVAHLELAHAACRHVDEIVLVLPRELPHKRYTGASFGQRVEMLCAAGSPYSIATTTGGLFVDIATEARAAYGPSVRLSFLCGRDAAERIAAWDYGHPDAFAGMLREFDLLVAARSGEYQPADEFQASVERLALDGDFAYVSASEVRRRVSQGEPWEHLVPPAIHSHVRKIYCGGVAL